MRRFHSIVPILLCCAVSLCIGGKAPAQETPAAPAAPVAPVAPQPPPKPFNHAGERKIESAITALDLNANPPKVTLRDGAVTLTLKPTTKIVKEERDLTAADLKVGDTLCLLTLKPTKGPKTVANSSVIKEECRVTALNPLTLHVSEIATLTLTNVELAEFVREVPLQSSDLAVGQTVAVKIYVRGGGDIDVQRLAVVTAKPKAPKKPKAMKVPTPRAKKPALPKQPAE